MFSFVVTHCISKTLLSFYQQSQETIQRSDEGICIALQNEWSEEIENVRDKYWNPATVTLTRNFNKTGLHHGHFVA